ncbi:MAG: phosphatase PAP2 family protein [bacterium]|nr:phosphatase PAP2 family protein [bacterium]
MKGFLFNLPRNILACFRGWNIFWYLLAIALTAVCVFSGFDWFYFESLRNTIFYTWFFPAAILGGLLPIIAPLVIFLFGKIRKNAEIITTAFVLGQAEIIGWLISSFLKAFTGRPEPPHILSGSFDISHVFRFGFWQGGIFWGWPSSHTVVAFAGAAALAIIFSKKRLLKSLIWLYAFYVGFGISFTIHWFSDFLAGAIIGSVIGVVVGKSFLVKKEGD